VLPEVGLYLPAAHARQAKEELLPEEGLYVPAAHERHAVDTEEYLPALQGVHNVAPADARVLVTLPAAHDRHEDWPEEGL